MSDPNATIGPNEARARPSPLHGATQHYAAIKEVRQAKLEANPTGEMIRGFLFKGIGVALLWWARGEWPAAAKAQEALQVGVVIGAAVVGLYLLAPTQILTLMKAVGGYLPWVKRSEP